MNRTPTRYKVAAGLLAFKAVLGLWAAVVLFSASRGRARTFLGAAVRRRAGGLGVVVLVFVAAAVVVVIGLWQARPWAPVSAYVLEAMAVLLALSRIGRRPGAALLSLALSAAIVSLVAAGSRSAPPAPS
jgi:hypothetical protein